RLPQAYGGGVGLDHGVELDRTEAAAPVPVDDVLRQRATDSLAPGLGADHERRGADVRTLGRPVGAHLGTAEEGASLACGDHVVARPELPGLRLVDVARHRVGLA